MFVNNNAIVLYKGGAWSCVHIDDPRAPKFKLPSINDCLRMKPSDILHGLLLTLQNPDGNGDEPPPLEGEDDDITVLSVS